MSEVTPQYITEEQQPVLLFSVCTLVASDEKYKRLLTSLEAHGFDASNSEFLALDNRSGNRFDGYDAVRRVFPQCRGKFILLTHDDIELQGDTAQDLEEMLGRLEEADPRWMVAGNAGWTGEAPERLVLHLGDPHTERRDARGGAVKVASLDENFLVMPRNRMVFPSVDLEGFHLFALDMCMQGRMAGGSSYVLPFFLRHHSAGNPSAAFEESRKRFAQKYSALGLPGRLRTPATPLYLGWRGALQRVFDTIYDNTTDKISSFATRLGSKKK